MKITLQVIIFLSTVIIGCSTQMDDHNPEPTPCKTGQISHFPELLGCWHALDTLYNYTDSLHSYEYCQTLCYCSDNSMYEQSPMVNDTGIVMQVLSSGYIDSISQNSYLYNYTRNLTIKNTSPDTLYQDTTQFQITNTALTLHTKRTTYYQQNNFSSPLCEDPNTFFDKNFNTN